MISSLGKKSKNPFQIYVLAMDDLTFDVLSELQLPSVVPVRLSDFEDPKLLAIKPSRGLGEYCWTCTPAIIRYCIQKYGIPECTYLDADLYFFNDPAILLDEARKQNKNVLITPHYYTRFFDQSKNSGIYCVQFMYFKNDASGLAVLEHWYEQCIDWCFARVEDGKFGDQKYLDVWPEKFPTAVHVLKSWGAGAPWNIQRYRLSSDASSIQLDAQGRKDPLVFYHFHGLIQDSKDHYFYGWYPLEDLAIKLIYEPYLKDLRDQQSILDQKFSGKNTNVITPSKEKRAFLKKCRVFIWQTLYPLLRA